MTENDPNSFIVEIVENLDNGRWVIRGRACEDLSIGDILTDTSQGSKVIVKVQSISSYGREINVLYKMMTGNLFIVGKNIDKLKSVKYLHKL